MWLRERRLALLGAQVSCEAVRCQWKLQVLFDRLHLWLGWAVRVQRDGEWLTFPLRDDSMCSVDRPIGSRIRVFMQYTFG